VDAERRPAALALFQRVCGYCGDMTTYSLPSNAHRNLAFVLILATGFLSLSAMIPRSPSSELQAAAVEIDFSGLHKQANEALDNLRRAPRTALIRPDAI
jgi:hypothetical protein